MSSIAGTDKLHWSDEQTRFYLQLRIEEKLKGNDRKAGMNEAGKESIIDKFYQAFGEKHSWPKFCNKHGTCKKQYGSFKKLTHNRTGLGYDSNGFIDMSDDWWNERCKEWPHAKTIRKNQVANMDLMETVFGSVNVTGAEGWSAQQGEEYLDSVIPEDPTNESDAASESRQNFMPSAEENELSHDAPSSNKPQGTKRKRKAAQIVADAIKESIESRDEILSRKNQLIESHPDLSCSQFRAMQVLNSLPSIRIWSPLYKAAIQHLKEDPTNRQTFLSYEEDENKVLYLEFSTGKCRDE